MFHLVRQRLLLTKEDNDQVVVVCNCRPWGPDLADVRSVADPPRC